MSFAGLYSQAQVPPCPSSLPVPFPFPNPTQTPNLTSPPSSLIVDPTNTALYINRTIARLKLGQWDSAIADYTACLDRSPDSMKAHYSLSQAHLALRAYNNAPRAYNNALRHALCVKAADKSLGTITVHVLRYRKKRWDNLERRRARETNALEAEVVALLEREREVAMGEAEEGDRVGREEVGREWTAKIDAMHKVFRRARPKEEKRK